MSTNRFIVPIWFAALVMAEIHCSTAVAQSDRAASDRTEMIQFDEEQKSIDELHAKIRELYRKDEVQPDPQARKQAEALGREMIVRRKMLAQLAQKISDELNANDSETTDSRSSNAEPKQAIAKTEAELASQLKQVAAHQEQLFQMASQFERQERSRRDTPIEGAVAQIFPLRHAKAAEAAGTLESLFGSQVRVAVDERSNNLVVSGKEKSLEAVRSLLQGLDEPTVVGNEEEAVAASPARTVLLRIFWLADGLPGDDGQDPSQILPAAVIAAMPRLGLSGPRLVTQTVNSLAMGDSAEVEFSTNVPAMLLGQHATLQCTGSMRPISGDRTGLNMDIHVSGPAINCELKGSLATPLGHYMVLGTANSVIAEPMAMAGGPMMGGGGFVGEGGFEMADPAAAVPGAEGGMGVGMEGQQMPKYNTSRFAFVVQVIEGESFPAEE